MNVKITLAETAGFCFGVARAVNAVNGFTENNEKVCTLGPLIHNPQFIASLEKKGVYTAESLSDVKDGYKLIIRTHGITEDMYEKIKSSGIPYHDATCPFVSKIHRIVSERSAAGDIILIAGDPVHPEVTGIKSCAVTDAFVFSDRYELEKISEKYSFGENSSFTLVAQTTFDAKEYIFCKKIAEKLYTNLKIFDTICNATALRQEEAARLSSENDMMIVIGGRNSSNTTKLFNICRENCPTYLIEDAEELNGINFRGVCSIGVTAGASTPDGIIKEVIKTMTEMNSNIDSEVIDQGQVETAENTEEMSFEQALEESLNSMSNDQKVVGTVMRIAPNEIQVDIVGKKQTGYIPIDEYSADPTADPTKELKIGDELNLIIMKTNDVEGTIMLSKRRFDAVKYWDDIAAAHQEGTILEGIVVEVIAKGLIVVTNGVRIFVPASQSTVPREGRLEDMLNKNVNIKIIDIDSHRRRAVGSIKEARRALRKENEQKFWSSVEKGQKFTGVVKSLTDYGAFVDLGGVDGMVHRTELSWKRIGHPSEVVNIGDTIDVYVKDLDFDKKKISLGYKKIEDSPWEVFKRDYPVDSVIDVKIVRIATFGAFAEIFPKIEGLIHISQIANRRIENPQEVLSIGDVVKVKITDIDYDKKRISLSMRALLPAAEPEAKVEEEPADDAPVVLSIDELIAKAAEAEAAEAETTDAE